MMLRNEGDELNKISPSGDSLYLFMLDIKLTCPYTFRIVETFLKGG